MPIGGDFAALAALRQALKGAKGTVTDIVRESSKRVDALVEDEFARGADPYGRAWAPLAPSTLARGRTPPPLTATGTMRGSRVVVPVGLTTKIRLPFPAAYHQTGTPRMPARPIVPDGGTPERWEFAVETAATDTIAKAFEVK